MQRIYEKNELTFSLLWIAVYVIGTSIADRLSESVGTEKVLTLPFLLSLSTIVFLWLHRQKLLRKYGLCAPQFPAKHFLYYLPFALMASCNLWFGITLNLSVLETFLYIGSMLCVGFLEELIFRGFLFRAMAPNGLHSAIVVSSLTFGIGHIVNLVNGSGADLFSNLLQVCYAVAGGFLFVIFFYRSGSLLPCIATHSILNALSIFASSTAHETHAQLFSAAALTVIALVYALFLIRKTPAPAQENSQEKV